MKPASSWTDRVTRPRSRPLAERIVRDTGASTNGPPTSPMRRPFGVRRAHAHDVQRLDVEEVDDRRAQPDGVAAAHGPHERG